LRSMETTIGVGAAAEVCGSRSARKAFWSFTHLTEIPSLP